MRLRPSRTRRAAAVAAVGGAARAVARFLTPDLTNPSAPVATVAWLDSFSPSLMPRTSLLQGVVGGLSILTARAVAATAERALGPALGPREDVPRRLGVRAATATVGTALTLIPEREGERLWRSGLRGGGHTLRALAVGGAIHDVGYEAWRRQPSDDRNVRAAVAVTSTVAGGALWAQRQLERRRQLIEPWPLEQRNHLGESVAWTTAVVIVGRTIWTAATHTRRGLTAWLGPGPGKETLATTLNVGLWTLVARQSYDALVRRVGRSNGQVEGPYATPPTSPLVSGSPDSHVRFDELGRQGRRFVTDVIGPSQRALMEDPPGTPPEAPLHPIRIYVGMDAEPLYPTFRAEVALAELERTGAYARRHLVLASPTGTGWVDQSFIESAELLTRGDIATVTIQYGRFPSFLAAQNVALGRSQFRILLLGVRERLRAIPPDERPQVTVFGESLGAWTASDVVMHQGIGGFDHYGIDTALWVGLPWLAKWSRSGMIRGASALVPPGTVGVYDRHEQLAALSPDARERLRAIILSHDNDPIARLGLDLAVARPRWLATEQRGRGVPAEMRWTPGVTFLQTLVDALNSLVQVPGAFTSFGHDYRADMAAFVRTAMRLDDVTDAELSAVEAALVRLDLDRAARLAEAVTA